MPFDNFYAESDKEARRWRKFLVIGFFAVLGYFAVSFLAMSYFERPEPSNELISPSERLRHVDALCGELPKPERFEFTGREAPIQYENATAVVYLYRSERNFDEIIPAFIVWFDSNGWKRVPESEYDGYSTADNKLTFTNFQQTVTISYYSFGYPNYKIYCHERTPQIYD